MSGNHIDPKDPRDNEDPVTGAESFHPAGTAAGAAAGGVAGIGAAAAAGAALGAAGGPAGLVVGAAIGAVAGGLAGKAVAERVNPSAEDEYWRANHANQPYADASLGFDDYQPAYKTGYLGRDQYDDVSFDEVEPDLQADYERHRGQSKLDWEQSREAVRASWNRVDEQYRDRTGA